MLPLFVGLRLRHLREHGPKEADVVFLILDDSLEIGHDVGVLDGFRLPAVFSNGRQLALDGVLKKGRQLLAEKQAEWARFHQGVQDVLSGGADALGLA